jgi:hypothetical protein
VTLLLAEHRAAGSSDPRFPWAGWHQDTVFPGQTPSELGAAYRNRTDDLRITRGTRVRHPAGTCTNSPADSAACTDSTEFRGPSFHDPFHAACTRSATARAVNLASRVGRWPVASRSVGRV